MNRVFRSNCLPVIFIVLMFTFVDHAIAQQVRDHRSNPTLSQARTVRDHRETPGAAAQWTVGGEVDTTSFVRLYNTARQRYLGSRSSGRLAWETNAPGAGEVIFENCTRPGEVVYSSDLVAIRYDGRFLIYASGIAGYDWTDNRLRGCEFRLIPSRRVFAPVGSDPRDFAMYNVRSKRYLVYTSFLPMALNLRWQETASGRSPADVAARADLVPFKLVFTEGSFDGQRVQAVYLTVRNIGNVRTSASQQVMKVTIRGEPTDFLVLQPVAPGAILQNAVRFPGALQQCERLVVELDTNRDLKFQVVGDGAASNADVFANDKKMLVARNLRLTERSRGVAVRDCEEQRVK